MRAVRITIGAVLLLALATGVLVGVWVLREAGGGGLHLAVAFDDAKSLRADHDVIYGDRIVGRVEDVVAEDGRSLVHVRIAADQAHLVREGSRFWIEETLSGAVLLFDTPIGAGERAPPGRRFEGSAGRPEPDPETMPMQTRRKLRAPPSWLCEVRVTLDLDDGTEFGMTQRRKGVGAVVEQFANGDLLVLAPSWVAQYSGDLLSETFRVELTGGVNMVAEPAAIRLPFIVLLVRKSDYAGETAALWPEALANEQALVLTDFEGLALTGIHREGSVEVKARIGQGLVALIDGTKVAGFVIPPVGRNFGATWVPLNGAGIVLDEARAKRE